MSERDLLCSDCGHHLHRPNPGDCQWRDCSCGPSDGPVEEPRPTAPWVCWNDGRYDCPTHRPRIAVEAIVEIAEDLRSGRLRRAEAAHPATPDGHGLTRAWREGYAEGLAAHPATEGLDVERLRQCPSLMVILNRLGKFNDAWWDRLAAEYLSSPEGQSE